MASEPDLPLRTGGDFRVERLLSKAGGMGVVYAGEQLSTSARCALKVMQSEIVAQTAQRKRFELEAKVGARIESEHVVRVFGAGVHGDMPWLAMELLEGEELAKLVETRGALSPSMVLEIFDQLCHARRAPEKGLEEGREEARLATKGRLVSSLEAHGSFLGTAHSPYFGARCPWWRIAGPL